MATITRRRILQSAATAGALSLPFVRAGVASAAAAPGGMTLAWHTNIAPRWLDPLQHDGSATPDNFLMVVHDALIKNYKTQLYDHLALADRFEFAEDATSATFRLRDGVKFHNGSPVTPDDVKWTYENYHGAWAQVLKDATDKVKIVDKRTVQFDFKEPFFDFPRLFGTANVCGAGWVIPANYYEKVGKDGFAAKPIGAGPYKFVSQEAGNKLQFEAFDGYYAPVHIKKFTIVSAPDAATRVAMLEREEADIIYFIPGEMIPKVQQNK
jgi:peptide/nickel transport system substrate-binding protein